MFFSCFVNVFLVVVADLFGFVFSRRKKAIKSVNEKRPGEDVHYNSSSDSMFMGRGGLRLLNT